MTTLRITATLEPRGPAGAFILSDEQAASVGDGKKAFPVMVTVNGTTQALRVARMGGEYMIGLSKAARTAAGVEIGERYAIEVALDAGARVVEVPDDFQLALDAARITDRFAAMAYSHRKEYVRWITEAKKEQTRSDRIAKAVSMIADGKTR